jgi:hypothetical protein
MDTTPTTCPGCGFPTSTLETLTGVCSKDGQPITQPRVEFQVSL